MLKVAQEDCCISVLRRRLDMVVHNSWHELDRHSITLSAPRAAYSKY